MSEYQADQLRAWVQALTWVQLVALWKWITIEMVARGPYAQRKELA